MIDDPLAVPHARDSVFIWFAVLALAGTAWDPSERSAEALSRRWARAKRRASAGPPDLS